MKSFWELAAAAYEAYCKVAEQQEFGTDANPHRAQFKDLGRQRQACWLAAVKQVADDIASVH